ncbi:hypothetical protein O6H91_02G137800 [Diphasiastrum complanatum]|uniref:Uncharacterized protein n=1 Tax=Diphasiastrum complanatum TaxID=34168 RepID=A0ACC2ELH9_DIPCM|nr:hypothetical protein O6H91_02G137800 [Diphasiastrum complanatum]
MALSPVNLLLLPPVRVADPYSSWRCHGYGSPSLVAGSKSFKASCLGLWPAKSSCLGLSQICDERFLKSAIARAVSNRSSGLASDHSWDLENGGRMSVQQPATSETEVVPKLSSNQPFSQTTRIRAENDVIEATAMPGVCVTRKKEKFSFQNQSFPQMTHSRAKNDVSEATAMPSGSTTRKKETFSFKRSEKLRNIKDLSHTKVGLEQQQSIHRLPSPLFVPAVGEPFFPYLDRSWSTPDHPIPAPGSSQSLETDCKFPWERAAADAIGADKAPLHKPERVKPPSLAELLIPQPELRRLRTLGIRLEKRLKIGRLGVTDGIVAGIHERWRNSEIVKVKCEGASALNMRKIHQDLERKTGGLVIWRSGGAAMVYRGEDYSGPAPKAMIDSVLLEEVEEVSSEEEDKEDENEASFDLGSEQIAMANPSEPQGNDLDLFACDLEYETEMDRFLDDLGPRYKDWTGRKRPVPVDGDVLPAVEATFKPPFRLLPYGVHPKLSNVEMTNLRRLARSLPPHFALGRNRGHQGLAMAIVKLWEKCEVAKIAVKRGVQNTNGELMAEELKLLTGGVLLSRDREFITLYRGKDFLPQALAEVLVEREAMTKALLEQEERVGKENIVHSERKEAGELMPTSSSIVSQASEVEVNSNILVNHEELPRDRIAAIKAARVLEAQKKQRRLAVAVQRKTKAEEELGKVQKLLKPSDPPADREMISDEEKHMFRKLGLKMNAFLLVGRRGVFDGVIENMHLHWKHRELVKLIYKGKNRAEIEETAKMLAHESGGILVGIVPTSKGQAIIVYRGKNYQRPPRLRPENLLTKREAWKRFTESQRRESLERHILHLEKQIRHLKDDLENQEGNIQENVADTGLVSDLVSGKCSEHIDESKQEVEILPGEKSHAEEDKNKVKGKAKKKGLGPIFRADPLTNKEKLVLRKQALKLGKPCHFHVGKSNVVGGIIRAIRSYFQLHALVKIGVKGRARGTAVAEIVQEIEDGTGGVLVSQEPCKLIFYRGWPEGQEQPSSSLSTEEISSDLIEAMKLESGDFDHVYSSYSSELDNSQVGEYAVN